MKYFIKSMVYFLFSSFLIRKIKDENIYISFDDGPHPTNTLKIIKILNDNNAKATFFMVGEEMEKYPDIVKTVINDGHAIGYHSFSHESLKKISFKAAVADFNKADALMDKYNIKSKLYRPPYGELTIMSTFWLMLKNWKIMMWSVDSGDSFFDTNEIIMKVDPSNLSGGDIVLFHDDYDKTVEILPEILNKIIFHKISCKVLTA